MIVSRLLGGLGNQLFQYAAGRRLAEKHGAELGLEISGFSSGYDLRRYELGCFAVRARLLDLPAVEAWVAGCARRQVAVGYVKEPHFPFFPGLLEAPDNVFLEGYWQSERYFADVAALIRAELALTEPLGEDNQRVLDAIMSANHRGAAVSLHVRRTDYVENPRTRSVHGSCGLDYYQRAITRLLQGVSGARCFVFSDDPGWTAANLLPLVPVPATLVTGNDGRGALDLTLMRHCRHHVIANSTFSWWGAWLADDPAKQVVAPARWFASPELDARDLVPAGWARL